MSLDVLGCARATLMLLCVYIYIYMYTYLLLLLVVVVLVVVLLLLLVLLLLYSPAQRVHGLARNAADQRGAQNTLYVTFTSLKLP